jgi:NitT/TauT family transport system permease protein
MTSVAAGTQMASAAELPPTELPAAPRSTARRLVDRFGWNGAVVIEVAFLLIMWQFAVSVLELWPPVFVPPPTEVAASLASYIGSGRLQRDAAFSLTNFAVGYFLAVVIGSSLGFALGTWARARAGVQPFLWIAYATPRVALQPLLLLWWGLGSGPKTLIVFLLAFFPIVFIVMEGVRGIDPSLLRVARVYGIRGRARYTKILLPASMPFLLTGLRIGLARGLVGMIIGEFIGGSIGLGYAISRAGQEFEVARILAITLILMLIATISLAILAWTKRRFAPWAED